ncbi:MAG: hypothetical protein JW786_06440 [Desulfobacterales bacterium]|nr:hypothetical protein [Desulfobacterales bacterium]
MRSIITLIEILIWDYIVVNLEPIISLQSPYLRNEIEIDLKANDKVFS